MIRTLIISAAVLCSSITPASAQVISTGEGASELRLLELQEVRISASQARQIVRNQYPNASRVIVTGLVQNSRRPYWEVRVEISGRQRSVRVDANSGAVF